jgi:FkbM family methyltransferase
MTSRCRLVELSEGPWLGRKLTKLRQFGRRYLVWFMANYGLRMPKDVTFPLFWGRPITLPFSMDSDFVTLYLTGTLCEPEHKLIRYLTRHLGSRDVFYDVGSHHGFYTYLAEELITAGEVHSFDPMPDFFPYLVRNCSGQVRVNKTAFWDHPGQNTLFVHSIGSALSTLRTEVVSFDPPRNGRQMQVSCTTIDEYLQTHRSPTFIKLDVEGAELQVIEGGLGFFSSHAPIVAMEIWGGEGGLRFSLPASNRLMGLGYGAYTIEEDGSTRGPLSQAIIEDWISRNRTWDNLIFQKGSGRLSD